jgi:type I restriction enzyme S subunit
VQLGEYAVEATELVDPRSEPDKEWPIYGVNNETGVFLSKFQKGADFNSRYKRIRRDYFFHNPTRANVGSLGRVQDVLPDAITSPEYQVWKPRAGLLPDFAEILIKTEFFLDQIECHRVGAVKERLFVRNLLEIPVPIPPLPIQQKIVAVWEAANSKANEDMVASQELARSTPSVLVSKIGLKALISPHSRRAFVSNWKEIERWGVELAREMSRRPNIETSPFPVVSLSDVIADLQNGWSPRCLTRPATEDEWGVLKVGAVSFGWFDERQNKALPPILMPREQYEVKSSDLIISRANIARYVGACALVDKVRPKLMLCDKLFRVVWKKDSPVLPKYLDEILKIPHLRWQIENNLTGASPTMKNISKPALMALRFPLPPLDIQKQIIVEVDRNRVNARALQDDARVRQRQACFEVEEMILGTRPVEVSLDV